MKIHKWKRSKRTIQKPQYLVSNGCQCGCSPLPFVFIFDGKIGITVEFETRQELNSFQYKVTTMNNTMCQQKQLTKVPVNKINPSKRYPQCPYCGVEIEWQSP